MAGYFDWQHAHAEDCLVADPVRAARRSSASRPRPKARPISSAATGPSTGWLATPSGMLGRTPDYVNVTLAGFVARRDIFERNGDGPGADAPRGLPPRSRARDLSLTHTIINPVIDKAVGDVEGLNGELAAARRAPDAERHRASAARRSWRRSARSRTSSSSIRATPCPGTPIPPTRCRFSMPLATPGLHTLCRDHYGRCGERRRPPVLAPASTSRTRS